MRKYWYKSKATPKGVKITRNSLEQHYAAKGTTERIDPTRSTVDSKGLLVKTGEKEDMDVARKLDEQRDKKMKALEKAAVFNCWLFLTKWLIKV